MCYDDFLQKLLDEVDDTWKKHPELSYDQLIDSLDEKHKAAILVVDFDAQIGNGGFEQWDWNRYSNKVGELIDVIDMFVKDTGSEVGEKVIKLIETYIDELQPIFIEIHSEPENPEMDGLYNDDYEPRVDELDDQYYEIDDRFMKEFSEWLIKKYGEAKEKQKVAE